MATNRELLNSDDVVTVDAKWNFMQYPTFRKKELIQKLAEQIASKSESQNEWFFEGVECEVLSPKQTWKKGKIRITIEFLPDSENHSVSDLDGLRQVVLE
jgi:hypothetical protein